MAIARKTPTCPYCGKDLAKAVYKNQSKIPEFMRTIGDTFLRWDYTNHECSEMKAARKKRAKEFKESGAKTWDQIITEHNQKKKS